MSINGEHFDVAIIGCGMSGLAAGIRAAMFGKQVIILERHNAPGGLNGFYSIAGRKYDVGLHAVTNYVSRGTKQAPLTKLFRQLRLNPNVFELCEQKGSRVLFPGVELKFNNDFELFHSEIARQFPASVSEFEALVCEIQKTDAYNLGRKAISARKVVESYIKDPLLRDMLFCPLMYYGSAREHDMDWDQFVIMFRSIFLQGFSRPYDGVRTIIKALLDKYRELGGIRRMKCGVSSLKREGNRITEIVLDNGDVIMADRILSSAGLVETQILCEDDAWQPDFDNVGRLSFVETISVLDKSPSQFGWDDTIIFFNQSESFRYAQSEKAVDLDSGVICFPNNYLYGDQGDLSEGIVRITAMANYHYWSNLSDRDYGLEKEQWFESLQKTALKVMGSEEQEKALKESIQATDMFTPQTIVRFTGHLQGAIYGASSKIKDGTTPYENLFLCGTDQGFLGIVGALLSGVSMANLHLSH